MYRTIVSVLLICSLLAILVRSALADLKIKSTSTETRFCTDAQVKAIFGAEVTGCYITSSKRGTQAWVRFCGGIIVSTPTAGVGPKAGFKAIQCFRVDLETDGVTAVEFMQMLSGETEEGKASRKKILDSWKGYLKSLDDESLERIGIERKDIDRIEIINFGPLKDKTGEPGKKIEEEIRKLDCPKPQLNS